MESNCCYRLINTIFFVKQEVSVSVWCIIKQRKEEVQHVLVGLGPVTKAEECKQTA